MFYETKVHDAIALIPFTQLQISNSPIYYSKSLISSCCFVKKAKVLRYIFFTHRI